MKRWTIPLFLGIHTAIATPSLGAFITPCSTTAQHSHSTMGSSGRLLSQHSDMTHLFTQQSSSNENDNLDVNNSQPHRRQQNQPQQENVRHKTTSSTNYRNSIKETYKSQDLLFQRQSSDPFRADFRDASEPKLMTTFGGGTALMFEMIAKRMLDWGNEAIPFNPEDDSLSRTPVTAAATTTTTTTKDGLGKNTPNNADSSDVLPRWHPYSGIADVNPNFRNQAPAMNNQGRVQPQPFWNTTTSIFPRNILKKTSLFDFLP